MIDLPHDVIENLIQRFGESEQLRQAMGECGEFVAAAQNYHRSTEYDDRNESLSELMEEAVDVYLMMLQVRYLDPECFDKICLKKRDIIINKSHQ